MSVVATAWAFEQEVSGNDKLVLLALADYAGQGDDPRLCFPGQRRVARMASVDVRTVRRCLKRLEDAGLITRERRQRPNGSRTSDLYILHLPDSLTGGVPDTGDRTHRTQVSGPEPSIEPSEKTSSEAVRKEDAPLSSLLADLMADLDPNDLRPAVTKEWADAERLMLERDGRNPDEAEALLRWAKADEFWATNIRSMPKFRKQYAQLWERRKQGQPTQLDEWGEEIAA